MFDLGRALQEDRCLVRPTIPEQKLGRHITFRGLLRRYPSAPNCLWWPNRAYRCSRLPWLRPVPLTFSP